MNTLNYEILNDIDRIDQCVMEAEMNVIDSLIETYTKSAMIMENYNGNDYSSFDIFQEAGIVDTAKKIGSTIVKFIKTTFKMIAMYISRIINYFSAPSYDKLIKIIEKCDDFEIKMDTHNLSKNQQALLVYPAAMIDVVKVTEKLSEYIRSVNKNIADYEELKTELTYYTKEARYPIITDTLNKDGVLKMLKCLQQYKKQMPISGGHLLKRLEFDEEKFMTYANEGLNDDDKKLIETIKFKCSSLIITYRYIDKNLRYFYNSLVHQLRKMGIKTDYAEIFPFLKNKQNVGVGAESPA